MFYKTGEILLPIVIHMVISNLTGILLASYLNAALTTTIAAVITLPIMLYFYQRDKKAGGTKGERISWWIYPLMGATGAVSNQLITFLMNFLKVTERFSNEVQEELFLGGLWIQLLGLGILVPILEEVLFRGLVYGRLRKYLTKGSAIFIGALLFALYHGNVVQAIFAFPMSILIIWSYERWKSLAVPIFFHVGSNLIAIILTQIR